MQTVQAGSHGAVQAWREGFCFSHTCGCSLFLSKKTLMIFLSAK